MASVICVYPFITSLKLQPQQQATKKKTKCKQSMIKTAFQFIVLVAVTGPAQAVTNGDNVDVFGPLCQTIQLADGALTFSPPINEPSQKASDIYKLNITVAPPSWRQLLTQNGEGTKTKKARPEPTGAPADWKTKWKVWTETVLDLEADKNEDTLKERFSIDKANEKQLERLRPTIAGLADTVYELDAFYNEPQTSKPKDDAALTTQLYEAIYGKKPTNMDQPETATMFEGRAQGYSASCGTGAKPPAGKTVAATFLCLCGSANSQTKKPCNAQQTTEAVWGAAAPPAAATAWPNLRQICPKRQGPPITAEGISRLIQAVLQRSRVEGSDVYIGGKANEQTCDANAAAACIKIAGGATNKQIKDDAIKWVKDLEDIATELRRRTAYNTRVTEYNAAMAVLENQVKATLGRAHYTTVDQPTVSKGDNTKESKTQLQKVNCNNHKTNATCTEANCKWEENATDKSKGECKPKEGEGTTNAVGTGDGAAGTTNSEAKKCSEKKKQEECKSPDCKWEGDTCKDSRFLVNKKLSLIHAA